MLKFLKKGTVKTEASLETWHFLLSLPLCHMSAWHQTAAISFYAPLSRPSATNVLLFVHTFTQPPSYNFAATFCLCQTHCQSNGFTFP